jgi:hypothetical protein
MNERERDAYYLGLAAAAAVQATCPRRKVGGRGHRHRSTNGRGFQWSSSRSG